MKKILGLIFASFLVLNPVFAADQWAVAEPAGTRSASDIDSYIGINNAALDRILINYRRDCTVIPASAATISVLAGELAIPNAAGTVTRWRRNTTATSVAWTDIDTGSEATSTQYYVYALADADATTFTVKISASSSAPSGATYYRKIGYFYNDSSGNIVSVGNIAGGDVVNSVHVSGTTDITTTSTSYTDMTDMVIYFVSSGRPVEVKFHAPAHSGGYVTKFAIDIDGTDVAYTHNDQSGESSSSITYSGALTSGAHTVKVQWRDVSGATAYQRGSTDGQRQLIVTEK